MKIQEKFGLKINSFFKEAIFKLAKRPSLIFQAIFLFRQQSKALKIRRKLAQENVDVPPMIIFSITDKCNLNCKGCYHHAQKRQEKGLSAREIERILGEAKDLGVSIALIAGGEPFIRQDLIPIIAQFPEILFVVFTNGTLIDQTIAKEIKRYKNLVPVISVEGRDIKTDERRGAGVYHRIENVLPLLKDNLFGISFTITKDNLSEVTDQKFLEGLIKKGSSVFFFVEYVPFECGTEGKVLTAKEEGYLSGELVRKRKDLPALFISFPGDEQEFGGCLAAGRGFLHISASGRIEPCPFSPYSDISLKDSSLKKALNSKLLAEIRKMPESLKEAEGGCALFTNREKVLEIINKKK